MSRMIAILALLLSATVATAQDAKPKWAKLKPKTPDGFKMIEAVVATYPEDVVKLTVYVPDKPGKYPCILDIHGGGWANRQVESDKPMMERLAQRGYVTAIIAYRLSTTSKFPAALHDCKSAVRTLRARAAEWKIDPDRIGVMGGSAGGHLSGLLAMTGGKPDFEGDGPHKDQSSAVKACIVMAATQDLHAANELKSAENAVAFFGATCADKPDLYRAASPIHHVRVGVPPVVFIEGEKDTLKVGRAEMMEKLKALHIPTAVHTLKDAPHPFWMSDPWCAQTVDIADAFFKEHLRKPTIER
ncbi:alpha/beta hydrolase [Humisphaera borealis]|uniref:Alpha/beta hydrolase n=1 Tax=Humisphaera borealis TaxID=2807512 RepID=A0A7M2WZF3_9BACT|nr:alpha/beta hydrolase [Humisphaera borealis]QOV90773.1 alpha/beta hydrolase [Humisphaera borealis]